MFSKLRVWWLKRKILTTQEPIIGEVIKYYPRIQVVVVKILTTLNEGQQIFFANKNNISENFNQEVKNLKLNNKPLKKANKGLEVSFKTIKPARQGMIVLKY